MLTTKFLIVGGGPAGASVGRFLSEKGLENIIIQRNFDYRKPCGGGIRLDAFDRFNWEKEIIFKIVKEVDIGFKDKKVSISIENSPIGIVDRKVFDAYLRDLASKKGSVLIEGSFIDFQIHQDYVVSFVKTKEGIKKIKSDYLISADGVNSIIRKKLTGNYGKRIPVQYVDIPEKRTEKCSFYFGKEIAGNAYGWVFPHFNGINIGTVKGKIKRFLKYLSLNDEFLLIKGFFIPYWDGGLFFRKRVFFVGDSAGQVLPFTFEGIYYAVYSAKILSDVLSSKEAPLSYELEWRRIFNKKFYTMKKLQELFLKNNISIWIMMRLFESEYIKREMVKLWLGKRDVNVDIKFFIRVLKRALKGEKG